jgi:hypothetical protein
MSRLAWKPLANTMIRINGACLLISRSCVWKLCCKRWKEIPLSSNAARRSHEGISDNMSLLVKHIQYDKHSWFSGRNCRRRKAIELLLVLQMGCTKYCFQYQRDGPARARNCSKNCSTSIIIDSRTEYITTHNKKDCVSTVHIKPGIMKNCYSFLREIRICPSRSEAKVKGGYTCMWVGKFEWSWKQRVWWNCRWSWNSSSDSAESSGHKYSKQEIMSHLFRFPRLKRALIPQNDSKINFLHYFDFLL